MSFWSRRALKRRRQPTPESALDRLRRTGFSPRTIYDIGAYRGEWSMLAAQYFPAAERILFEANTDNVAYFRPDHGRLLTVALGNTDGASREFFLAEGAATGASLYLENTPHFAPAKRDVRMVTTARLDTLVSEHGLPAPDLIKIDVQGAEIDVFDGAPNALAHCQAVLAEVSLLPYNKDAPLMADVVAALARRGFACADLCELHHMRGDILLQIDLLFVKPALLEKYGALAGLG